MPLGGLLTGFVGGLSGQQGALRSMFLLKSGLDARRYIATGVLIAIVIDLSRLPAYAASLAGGIGGSHELALILTGVGSAFGGAWAGARFVEKVTLGIVRAVVTALLLAIGTALVTGVLGSASG